MHGANGLIERGASEVYACCTHPVLSQGATERIAASPIRQLVVTDTIPFREKRHVEQGNVTILSVAPLLADAIKRIHKNESVSQLFDRFW